MNTSGSLPTITELNPWDRDEMLNDWKVHALSAPQREAPLLPQIDVKKLAYSDRMAIVCDFMKNMGGQVPSQETEF